jgi:phenylpyruvate tautomerase
MPYLALATNLKISDAARKRFLREASKAIATGTGKPEQYVMVKLTTAEPMLFAGNDDPAAFIEIKSIGFPPHSIPALTASLCDLVATCLLIPADRTYIVFTDVKPDMWGHDGETFG